MIAEYIYNHQPEFWIMLGFSMLVIEVSTGFITGLLLFGGIGAVMTGLLMLAGVINETWETGIASTAISAVVIALLLWKPLKKMQNADIPRKDNSSDLVGYEFVLSEDINLLEPGKTQYSGIDWNVEIHKDAGIKEISASTRVVVCSVDVGKFRVKPV